MNFDNQGTLTLLGLRIRERSFCPGFVENEGRCHFDECDHEWCPQKHHDARTRENDTCTETWTGEQATRTTQVVWNLKR